MGKTHYLMKKEWNSLFRGLPKEQAGELIQAICAFTDGEDAVIENPLLSSVCEMIKSNIASNDSEYEESCRRRNLGNLKRWHPDLYKAVLLDDEAMRSFLENPYEWLSIHKDASESLSIHKDTQGNIRKEKEPDTDSDSVTDSVTDTVTDKPKGSSTPPKPSPKTITSMIEEKNYSPDLKDAVMDWVRYKKERKEGYGETGLKRLLSQIANTAAQFGDGAVISAMNRTMAAGYVGIVWDWAKEEAKNARDKPAEGWGQLHDPYKEWRNDRKGSEGLTVRDGDFERLVIDD